MPDPASNMTDDPGVKELGHPPAGRVIAEKNRLDGIYRVYYRC
ncbi:hypothetical protein [Pseudonocardia alni]|nr:hypothetical protein [Pseudonocardia alni]